MERPFQITIKRMLLAVLCMAVCFASLAALADASRDGSWRDNLYAVLGFLAVESPFIALGVLCRRTLLAAIVGLVAWVILAPWISLPYE